MVMKTMSDVMAIAAGRAAASQVTAINLFKPVSVAWLKPLRDVISFHVMMAVMAMSVTESNWLGTSLFESG